MQDAQACRVGQPDVVANAALEPTLSSRTKYLTRKVKHVSTFCDTELHVCYLYLCVRCLVHVVERRMSSLWQRQRRQYLLCSFAV